MPSANPKSGWTGTASRAADGRRRIAGDGVGSQEPQSDDGVVRSVSRRGTAEENKEDEGVDADKADGDEDKDDARIRSKDRYIPGVPITRAGGVVDPASGGFAGGSLCSYATDRSPKSAGAVLIPRRGRWGGERTFEKTRQVGADELNLWRVARCGRTIVPSSPATWPSLFFHKVTRGPTKGARGAERARELMFVSVWSSMPHASHLAACACHRQSARCRG